MKNNYVSFSLWGDQPIYTNGAIKNVHLVREIYHKWQVVIFYDNSVPAEILNMLTEIGVDMRNMTNSKLHPLFWRFLAADFEDCGYAVFRDTDSRVSQREYMAVLEWIDSGKLIHLMRDHPYHKIPHGSESMSMLGGMWGVKGGVENFEAAIVEFSREKNSDYGIDQSFLSEIYKKYKDTVFKHDDFFDGQDFPLPRENFRFIGERMDESDTPVGLDWKVIEEYYKREDRKRKNWIEKIKRFLKIR